MSARHTPGPWYVDERQTGNGLSASVVSATGATIALAKAAHGNKLDNVRLIAAAPELLEGGTALETLVSQMQAVIGSYLPPDGIDADDAISKLIYLLDGPEQRAAQDPLKAAIAKATGEA